MVLAPKLLVRLCAESSLLCAEMPGTASGGPRRRVCVLSCGVWLVPMGVASDSLGGPARTVDAFDAADGTAELLTGRWLGDAGMARPNRGIILGVDSCRPDPGMGGRCIGVGVSSPTPWGEGGAFCATMGRLQWELDVASQADEGWVVHEATPTMQECIAMWGVVSGVVQDDRGRGRDVE